jgi:hypothetical protein
MNRQSVKGIATKSTKGPRVQHSWAFCAFCGYFLLASFEDYVKHSTKGIEATNQSAMDEFAGKDDTFRNFSTREKLRAHHTRQ